MALKSKSKGFTLVEVIVAVAVLATALVFVTRSFTAVMSSTRLCQDIARACFLADDKMFEITRLQADATFPLVGSKSTDGKFTISYEGKSASDGGGTYAALVLMHERVSWPVKEKAAEYPLDLYTYLFQKK